MTLTIDRSETAKQAAAKPKPRGGALDPFFEGLCFACATALMGALCWVLVSLFIGGWPALHKFGLGFLTTVTWNPVTEVYGAAGPVVGTLITAFLALLISLPIAFGIAVFLVEFCPPVLRRSCWPASLRSSTACGACSCWPPGSPCTCSFPC